MTKTYPGGQPLINIINEATRSWIEIPPNFDVLLNLLSGIVYNEIMIFSTLDTDCVLKIGQSEITILSGTERGLSNFPYLGKIEYRYVLRPTEGKLQIYCY